MAGSRKRPDGELPSGTLIRAVEGMLRQHAKPGDAITVGLSGGIDSVVLLDALRLLSRAWNLQVSALHVNHGLSPNAGAWEDFCRRHCARREVSFQSVRVTVAGSGSNVEEEARLSRYRAFEQQGAGILALAHNRDDQAETVLLRLLRGAGVHGLAGMPEVRLTHDGRSGAAGSGQRLIRPLLSVSREAIHAYAIKRRLRWVDDESNAESRFARNFLRIEILPALERRFPGCRAALVRAAGHLREADAVLERLASDDLQSVMTAERLDAAKLAALGGERAARALRLALTARGEPPLPTVTTREVLRQLLTAAADSSPQVVLAHVALRRYRGLIEILPAGNVAETNGWRSVPWTGGPEQRLPDGSTVRARSTAGAGVSRTRLGVGSVSFRRRQGGEKIRLRSGGPARTLKNLLQEHAVPPWERDSMPLLYCNEQLVWIPSVGVASDFLAQPGEPAWEFSWQPD